MNDPRYKTQRWARLRLKVIRRDGPHCAIPSCQTAMSKPSMICIDHIVDVKDGGDFWNPDNLQVLCWHHNIAKGHEAQAARYEPTSPNR